jgi:hypothetical protein
MATGTTRPQVASPKIENTKGWSSAAEPLSSGRVSALPLLGRSFAHWTPRYVYRRLLWWHYQRTHADYPWLTPMANWLLERLLRCTDEGIEWGSGLSTCWFARRVGRLIAVETDTGWYDDISRRLAEGGLGTVDYRLLPEESGPDLPRDWEALFNELREKRYDFAVVDGAYRDHCALCAVEVVRPGGLIVVDNVNRYLPSRSQCPRSIPPAGQPTSPLWAAFAESVREWRCVWTSQGITDTAIWISGE